MHDWLDAALTMAKPYWPFLAKLFSLWFVTNSLKKNVFTKARGADSRFISFMRVTMWAHTTVLGIMWGCLYPFMPACEMVTTRGGAINEGILAGVFAVIGFMLLEAFAEKYQWTAVLKVMREVEGPPTIPPPPDDIMPPGAQT